MPGLTTPDSTDPAPSRADGHGAKRDREFPVGCQDYSRQAALFRCRQRRSEPPVFGAPDAAGRVVRLGNDVRSAGANRVRGGGIRRSGPSSDPDADRESHEGDRTAKDRIHLLVPF